MTVRHMLMPRPQARIHQPNLVLADTSTARAPRFGQISFANCLPITLPIERRHVDLQSQISFEHPAQLNAMFEAGQLDVSAMSSYYYLTRSDLVLLPHISISCWGPVGSVLLFSKKPPQELQNAQIVASAQSASSVNLLKLLIAEYCGYMPEVTANLEPNIDSDEVDAALVIGDRALEVDRDWSNRYYRLDLGEWWWQTQQVPMVFGVWAATKNWANNNSEKFELIADALQQAKTLGLRRGWKDTLHEANRRTGLSLERLDRYYRAELNFDLTDEHRAGLERYRQLLIKHGLLQE